MKSYQSSFSNHNGMRLEIIHKKKNGEKISIQQCKICNIWDSIKNDKACNKPGKYKPYLGERSINKTRPWHEKDDRINQQGP